MVNAIRCLVNIGIWFIVWSSLSAIIIGTLGIVHLTTNLIRNVILGGSDSNLTLSQLIDQLNSDYGWILKILVNLFGYSCIIVPGLLIFQYTKRTQYLDRYGWLNQLKVWMISLLFYRRLPVQLPFWPVYYSRSNYNCNEKCIKLYFQPMDSYQKQ